MASSRSARIWSGGSTGKLRLRQESGITPDLPAGFTPWQERMSAEEQAERRQASLGRGQIDFGLDSPLLLAAILDRQRNRRRSYAGTLLTGGLGVVDDEKRRGKTLLGR